MFKSAQQDKKTGQDEQDEQDGKSQEQRFFFNPVYPAVHPVKKILVDTGNSHDERPGA